MYEAARCMWMRAGTSKGGFFLSNDLPKDRKARDKFLLRAMGSPDIRQIDGMGGADPVTSKVAIIQKSDRPNINVDYLFLQVSVDHASVSDSQNCGNILAGVGPFAIERGLVKAGNVSTDVSIFMENTGQIAVARIQTPNGKVQEIGEAQISGVPSTGAPITLTFKDTAGSSCGALLPSEKSKDFIEGVYVTMIDDGMPCVILKANDVGITGRETPNELNHNLDLKKKLELIRLRCGVIMNLGNVQDKTVPKVILVSKPNSGGAICTRSFIPHRCHQAIGVLAAVSLARACLIPASIAFDIARNKHGRKRNISIEHPSGEVTVVATLDKANNLRKAAILRTARKLMDGMIFG